MENRKLQDLDLEEEQHIMEDQYRERTQHQVVDEGRKPRLETGE
jgi:hypothetical protein